MLDAAAVVLGARRYRLRLGQDDAVSAEKGYLREVGNLLFHLSVIVVLVGFALGSRVRLPGRRHRAGRRGPAPFTNAAASYDDFDPGSGFGADDFDPFSFTVDDFDITWLTEGSGCGTAREFNAKLQLPRGRRRRRRRPTTCGSTTR